MNNKVCIISFSSRKNGNCEHIAEQIVEYYDIRTNVHYYSVDAEDFGPCGGCDYECLKPGVVCPRLNDRQKIIMDTICSSDLVYYIVPNYCGYPCANYYAFNERCVGYFGLDRMKMNQYMSVKKRFIVVSNTQTEAFRSAMQQQTKDEPEILYMMTGKYHKKSIAGDLMESDAAKADLEAFLDLDPL
jgi:multimeric flavodoxin WrbA